MADKKPTELIKIFYNSSFERLECEINEYLKDNPELYIDKMQFSINVGATSCRKYVVCDFRLKEGFKEEESGTNLTEELLKGLVGAVNELIGAVNELTDAVKSLTKK